MNNKDELLNIEKQIANKNKDIEKIHKNIETAKKKLKSENERLKKFLKEKETLESRYVLETLKANNMTINELKEFLDDNN